MWLYIFKSFETQNLFPFQSQFSVQKSETAKARPQQSSHISSTKSSDDWGWGNEQDLSVQTNTNTSVKPHKGALKLGGPKKAPVEDFGWIEEEFAPIEDSSVEPASSYNWGQMDDATGGDDFFSMAGGITSQVCIHASRLEVRGGGRVLLNQLAHITGDRWMTSLVGTISSQWLVV